jgi:hypothetical protein
MCYLCLNFGNIIICRLEICHQSRLVRRYSPIILMATISLVILWEAFHTVPKEPVPSFSSSVYATDGSALDVDSFISDEMCRMRAANEDQTKLRVDDVR